MTYRDLTRRGFVRVLGTAAGAAIGYGVGKGLTGSLGDAVIETYAELSGVVKRRMEASATEAKQYLGETEQEMAKMTKYWDNVLGGFQQEAQGLRTVLENVDRYVEQEHIGERVRRSYDRLLLRVRALVDAEQEAHKRAPSGLQKVQEAIARFWKGKERGSNDYLRTQMNNLESMVNVYNSLQTTGLAQSGLLNATNSSFQQAQEKVVEQLKMYLADKKITEEDRQLYQGMHDLAQKDPTGKALADFLINNGAQLSTADVLNSLQKLKGSISKFTGDLTRLQTLYDEGLTLKQELRDFTRTDVATLHKKVQEYTSLVERRKEELQQAGYAVNYSVAPEWGSFGTSLFGFLGDVRKYANYTIAGLGGLAGLWLSGIGNKVMTRREIAASRKEKERLASENERLTAKIERLKNPRNDLT